MQAYSRWTPPQGTLGAIVIEARARAGALQRSRAELSARATDAVMGPSLEAALRVGESVAVIAEVKRRSPSKGAIAESLGALDQAMAYQEGGAAAISILTEPAHFGGSAADLLAARSRLDIPTLKKDFHVAPIQLIEAVALGASAALLIARALSPDDLAEMMDVGMSLDLEMLVEVRDERELERAINAGARIIGVNNRNLETLVIDPDTSHRIIPMIPESLVAVAESGIRSPEDVDHYGASGAHAVLVGSVLSAAPDPAGATRAMVGRPRVSRAG